MDERIPENKTPSDPEIIIRNVLTENIFYQKKWHRWISQLHVLTTVGSIICSAGATVFAASGYSTTGATFAAFATVFISVEKSMMLSEKWRHHLYIETRLRNIQLKFETGQMASEECVAEISKIMEAYSDQLLIENQEAMDEIKDLLAEINKTSNRDAHSRGS